MIRRPKPQQGITKEQYDLLMKSLANSAGDYLKSGNIPNIPAICWEATRPDVTWQEVDLTERLNSEIEGFDRVCEKFVFHILLGGDGNPLMAFGVGKKGDKEVWGNDDRNVSDAVFFQIDDILDRYIKERWPDLPEDERLSRGVDRKFDSNMKKAIDDKVAEYREEMDSLFETWRGGEGSG